MLSAVSRASTDEFRREFARLAKVAGFEKSGQHWFMSLRESIVAINLQRSAHGYRYYMNYKIWIQGLFGTDYHPTKELFSQSGHVFRREPPEYELALDLENGLPIVKRFALLEQLFQEFVLPVTDACSSKAGISDLHQRKLLFLLPGISQELGQ